MQFAVSVNWWNEAASKKKCVVANITKNRVKQPVVPGCVPNAVTNPGSIPGRCARCDRSKTKILLFPMEFDGSFDVVIVLTNQSPAIAEVFGRCLTGTMPQAMLYRSRLRIPDNVTRESVFPKGKRTRSPVISMDDSIRAVWPFFYAPVRETSSFKKKRKPAEIGRLSMSVLNGMMKRKAAPILHLGCQRRRSCN